MNSLALKHSALWVFALFFNLCSLTFAEDSRNVFLKWLQRTDPNFSQEVINQTNQKFRQKFGFLQTRYSDAAKGEWSPAFLALAEQSFEEKTGKTISDFSNITNNQMKDGISTSISRFASASQEQFSDIFSQYLSSNLKLAKSGRDLSPSESNQDIWRQSERVAGLESMGGNAGAGAVAVNFLFDKQGRIVFVGNFQDASPDIRTQYGLGRLYDGTVRYAVDKKIWQLFTRDNLTHSLRTKLTQDLTQYHGTPPIVANDVFHVQCELALKKLLGR